MRLKKGLMLSAIALAGVLTLSACTDSAAKPTAAPVEKAPTFAAGTTMAKLSEAGSITIGTKFDQPLFGLRGPDGQPVGFDVEMGTLIASKLGIPADKIKWTETVSANREPFIQNGQVDLVVATYTINDTRKQVVDFAGPYYEAGQDLLVLAGNPDKIKSPEDLAGKSVCTVSGSTSEKNITAYTDKVLATDTYSNCLGPLRSGEVVAVTTDNVILAGLADQNAGEFEVVDKPFTKEPYGIGLKKGDTEFRTFINDTLEESFKDGTWAKAWEKTAGTVLETPTPPAVNRY
ncbi:glutamate ABC transporter substrate-binding protein [Cryobacterium sp. TMT1-21]|uniref:Glutamate ABC transporter substrate-binding protein n=2 Tax=Microbacteriaceae TaxID=85023 RepID=A0AAQ2HFP3_9MICO|nr:MULTISPECIES: glutamate ABC transporter substrate-binding protein [Cryobacterium]TFC48452.1 glutamate ABC transporter substrate-binding protein [Cryobacterium shii]TFD11542.1 glutamate ABC transporter substrate-binding protein [Cryobacterium sp. TMT1-21]TFD43741.1 glutamate ABC transporter substrate-binding protein [Cryobacterium sp. TMT2-10]